MNNDPFYAAKIPEHVPSHLVHDFNLYDFGGIDPFEAAHNIHKAGAPEIFWTRHNEGHWVLSRAAAILDIASDTVHFSSDRNIVPDSQNFSEPTLLPLQLDPPLHGEYRKIVAPRLSPKRVGALEGRVREMSLEIIKEIKARGRCEFMADFAAVVPVGVFLEFMDLPQSDRTRLLQIASDIVKPPEGMHREQPLQALFDYLTPIIIERTENPGDDVLSLILASSVNGQALTRPDALRLCSSVILGGLDTIAASLGYLVGHLARAPDLRQELLAHPDLIPAAVEESLRRFPVAAPGRTVLQNCEVRGVNFRKGDHVIWTTGMFNFDENVHQDPMKFDIHRKRAQHATFGIGIHFCIGNFLTKMEMKVFLETWLNEIPDFYIDPDCLLEDRIGLNLSYDKLPLIIGAAK